MALIWFGQEKVTVDSAAVTEEERRRYLEFRAIGGSTGVGAGGHGIHVRPGVDHVEGTVKDVVGPVYNRFHIVPLDILKLIDRKVKRRRR